MYRDHTAVSAAHFVKPEHYLTQTFHMQIPEQPLNHFQSQHLMMNVPPLHTPHPAPPVPVLEPIALPPPLPPPLPPDPPQPQVSVQYTKSGTVRLRKKYDSSVEERIAQKKNRIRSKYLVREGCDEKCTKKCTENFSELYRHQINKEFWEKSWSERRLFIRNCSDLVDSKRRVKGKQKRRDRKTFSLISENGDKVQVCKIFLLTTLGFKKNNDRVLYNSLKDKRMNISEINDGRGRYTKTPTVDRELLKAHVESFQPRLSLYNEELVPLKKYLPNDITVKAMYNDFREKYPSIKVSYDLYRKNIKSLNISFARRGGEDCQLYSGFEMGWTDLQVQGECATCN
ncbi:hypothetical protein EVAR_49187_1 [Eumeta japonica]|uniref:Uncharacterized protein n=1 Tax=Eumeta variegata TaxID=151549 RepID=A0A4C1YER4_EUMVA|nr:hypothetical protein EVAR_49187_1 [Eumeta japonica]